MKPLQYLLALLLAYISHPMVHELGHILTAQFEGREVLAVNIDIIGFSGYVQHTGPDSILCAAGGLLLTTIFILILYFVKIDWVDIITVFYAFITMTSCIPVYGDALKLWNMGGLLFLAIPFVISLAVIVLKLSPPFDELLKHGGTVNG